MNTPMISLFKPCTVILAMFFLNINAVFGQLTLTDYINRYKDIAMEEMRLHGIPASIKLGQGILESGFGNSELSVNANNHFGIKCHGWQGKTYFKDDDAVNECFRAYDDPEQSFRDHSAFLTGRPRYAGLFDLEITNYKAWAQGLRQAGYATNPRYPELLIRVIEQNNLHEFDRMVLSGTPIARTQVPATSPAVTSPTAMGRREEFPAVGTVREIFENNRIKYVYARQGDTPASVANETGVWEWEIVRYNDLKNRSLAAGQIIYLQPKRYNAGERWHTVQEGESLYDISQKYGVRIKALSRRNNLKQESQLQPGTKIKLKAFAR
jgi:LysM repeat protein